MVVSGLLERLWQWWKIDFWVNGWSIYLRWIGGDEDRRWWTAMGMKLSLSYRGVEVRYRSAVKMVVKALFR